MHIGERGRMGTRASHSKPRMGRGGGGKYGWWAGMYSLKFLPPPIPLAPRFPLLPPPLHSYTLQQASTLHDGKVEETF